MTQHNPIQHMIEKYGRNPTQPNFGQRVLVNSCFKSHALISAAQVQNNMHNNLSVKLVNNVSYNFWVCSSARLTNAIMKFNCNLQIWPNPIQSNPWMDPTHVHLSAALIKL